MTVRATRCHTVSISKVIDRVDLTSCLNSGEVERPIWVSIRIVALKEPTKQQNPGYSKDFASPRFNMKFTLHHRISNTN